jgi:hypothetical protein
MLFLQVLQCGFHGLGTHRREDESVQSFGKLFGDHWITKLVAFGQGALVDNFWVRQTNDGLTQHDNHGRSILALQTMSHNNTVGIHFFVNRDGL